MFTKFFISRPIFAAVLSVIVVLAGAVAQRTLPVAQYPEITPPTVEVSCVYPGANARTVGDTVAAPIEQQVNGVEDMLYMSSRCTNDGSYALTVTFKSGTDLNIAQVLVQNRVNLAAPVLPDLVKRRGVLVNKKSPTQLMIVNLFSPDGSRSALDLSNYATIQLRDELARLPGVGDITYLGQRDYSMRLWLDPEKMAVRGLSGQDVVHAVEQQNAQVAAGQVGQPPVPGGQAFQYTISTLGRLATEDQFADIVVKSDVDGRVVRVRDVARVQLGANSYDQACTLDGRPSVALSVYQLPGTNAIETARAVRAKMAELKAKFPEGTDYAVVYDTTPFIEESVREVFVTLRDAVLLVAAVMLLFLQSWRAAIIPLAAVPVAIVGTFAAMWGLGYSLNNLTLFGLVLAVGIVVDDAIVVVEAVQHHIEEGMDAKAATEQAMSEVTGPVIAVGLVLAAVFVPCVFISGIVGEFFRQFAVTIAVSTLLSAFNSVTLSPALCALLLRPGAAGNRPLPGLAFAAAGAGAAYYFLIDHAFARAGMLRPEVAKYAVPVAVLLLGAVAGYLVGIVLNRVLAWIFAAFNRAFDAATGVYLTVTKFLLRAAPLALVAYGGLVYLTATTVKNAPAGFIPNQDKGYLLVNVQLPDSASLNRTNDVVKQIDNLARAVPGVNHTVAVSGQSVLLGANAANFGTVYVMLAPFDERPGRAADAVAADLRAKFADGVGGAVVNVFGAPPVDGLGAAGGFTLIVEDPTDTGPRQLQAAGRAATDAAAELPSVRDAFTGFRADTPWLDLKIDRTAAKSMGVPVSEVIGALQVYFGSYYINDFNRFGRTWQVTVQADGRYRQTVEDLKKIRVRSDSGEMVPIGAFLGVSETTGPVMVQRYNLYPCAAVTVTPAAGASSGEVLSAVEEAVNAKLPPAMQSEWTELARLQQDTGDTAYKAFALAVVLAFLVLSAQYESWALPFAVVLVVPLCLLSATAGIRLAGLELNIFTQVGFVVLVGLACKNAILIVEFAKQKHEAGLSRWDATLAACKLRLRPIIMTSVAFILGVLPLVLSQGAGAEMRRALGTAVFAGMIGVTFFGVFLTPVFFFTVQWVLDKLKRREPTGV